MQAKIWQDKFKGLSKKNQSGVLLSVLGIVGWSLAIIVMKIFSLIFETNEPINWVNMGLVPLVLIVSSVLFNIFNLHRRFGVHPSFVTAIFTGMHGFWALFASMQIHSSYNGYLVLFLFSFGMLYLKISFGLIGTLVFSAINLLAALSFIILMGVDFGTDEAIFVIFFVFHGISSSLINEINQKKTQQLRREIKYRQHSYEQMKKVFFPHQLKMIADGQVLELTMPMKQGTGACILFEVIDSHLIQHELAQMMIREIFAKFSILIHEKYDAETMQSNAFRIVELNNRFVCTVGFPFQCPNSERPSRVALKLSRQLLTIFHDEIKKLDYPQEIHGTVAIASGEFEGFYTHGFPIEYHLYGSPLTHVEHLNEWSKINMMERDAKESLIIIEDRVFNSLSHIDRKNFSEPKSGLLGFHKGDKAGTFYFEYFSTQANVDAA